MKHRFRFIKLAIWTTLFGACEKNDHTDNSIPAGQIEDWVHGIGYVEPEGEVRRLAFKHPGIISECLIEPMTKVRKGDILLRLANTEEKAAVNESMAALVIAKAQRALTSVGTHSDRIAAQEASARAASADATFAEKEYHRLLGLPPSSGASSQAEKDKAQKERSSKMALQQQAEAELNFLKTCIRPQDIAIADALVKHAEARVEVAQTRLSETELRAPSDGTVLEVLQREGNSAHSAFPDPVVIFGNLTHLYARAEIDETYALRVKPGQKALIRTRGKSALELTGTVQLVKNVMGKKSVFAKTSTERKDLDVIQILIDLPAGTSLPIGLEVDVKVAIEEMSNAQ